MLNQYTLQGINHFKFWSKSHTFNTRGESCAIIEGKGWKGNMNLKTGALGSESR